MLAYAGLPSFVILIYEPEWGYWHTLRRASQHLPAINYEPKVTGALQNNHGAGRNWVKPLATDTSIEIHHRLSIGLVLAGIGPVSSRNQVAAKKLQVRCTIHLYVFIALLPIHQTES